MENQTDISTSKRPNWLALFPILLVAIGICLLFLSLHQAVTIQIDGESKTISSFALTPAGVIKQAGIELFENDQINPPLDTFLFSPNIIKISRAQTVQVLNEKEITQLSTTSRIPAILLQQAGIKLFPKDQILWNGSPIDPDTPLTKAKIGSLQYVSARTIFLEIDGEPQVLVSAQPTLGMALHEAGIQLAPEDWLSTDLESPLSESLKVEIRKGRTIQAKLGEQTIQGKSSAIKVSDALADLGIVLQGADYAIPGEDEPVPSNGQISLVRVRESLELIKEEFPFQVSYAPDPEMELDGRSVIQPGVTGLLINRTRIRYENGVETARLKEAAWRASEPQDGILGYGTQVFVRSEVVDGINLEYYRKLSVYATSYSPSRQGEGYDGTTKTASGLPLEKGIVAVLPSWYRAMKLQQVYIPGYGFGKIADTGGGIPGTPWIDLGYSDSDYVGWHSWVSMYFLTPVPQSIPYLLP